MSNHIQTIDVAELLARLDANEPLTVIDVRSPAEYGSAHIAGAVNVPLDVLTAHAGEVAERLSGHPQGSVVLVCQSGVRAEQACRRLGEAGLRGLPVLTGGTSAYLADGGPAVRGRRRWALERQVRLVAGGIVASSILASVFAPKARFVAGAIGSGLVAAAVTDTCAMGRMLSVLPYNRGPQAPGADEVLDRLRAA